MSIKLPRRTGQSRFVLLGLLKACPGSGYDLRRRIEQSVGNFWSESWGQIYPALKALEAEKLVRATREAGKAGPERRVYEVTTKGMHVLREWLMEAVRPSVPRNELLLKLFFAHHLTLEQSLRLVEERRISSNDKLKTYLLIEEILLEKDAVDPELPYWLITVRHGIAHMKTEIEWCFETRKALRAAHRTKDLREQ